MSIVSPKNGQPAEVYYKENESYDLAGNETATDSPGRANISAMSFVQRVSFYDGVDQRRKPTVDRVLSKGEYHWS